MTETIQLIADAVEHGKSKLIKDLVPKAIEEGNSAQDILNEGLLKGMGIIGEKFTRNEVYVPEVLVAARAMNKGTELLKPLLLEGGMEPIGKACIGTVAGDLHDIGKNLVRLMMESKNIEVIDLGTDVSPEIFAQTAKDENCDLVCCSALLTTTMPVMADVIKTLEEAGIRDRVKVFVGGAPVDQSFCDRIGADIYTDNAGAAALKAVEVLSR